MVPQGYYRRIALTVALVLTAACGSRGAKPAILLFDGRGTSAGDVAAIEAVLNAHHLDYATAGSLRLNLMTEPQIREYRLLIVPGGNFVSIGDHLSPDATAHIRSAVHNSLNYLGICAGAFFAGNSPYNGLNLTSGVQFPFYAAESRGIRKSAVSITTAAGSTLDQYWEDGPQLTGWGAVVAKYPDQTPAIVEGTFGNGWMILSGVHPEADAQSWRGMNLTPPVATDHAYAASLIEAALNRTTLPHY